MNAVDELNLRLGIGPSRPQLPITLQRSGYTPVRMLGKGSFGNAYLVFHAERKEQYVVKHVNMSSMTARQRKDAHQEIAVLQQLEYPNIIRYVEFYEEHPHLYIVMEYADGGDVYTHLKHLRSSVWALGSGGSVGLTEEQVISLFVQTTMAVKYMHDRRLLHRDIKSQNVFLTHNHVVKLGDFGISTVLMSTVAMAQTMCGTPCYFSPELCQGKPYNNKSDVWALGVLLYELCTTGRLPFEASSMNRLMDEICNKEPRRIPTSFSEELWRLVQWMLKKDPRQRPDAGQILRSPVLIRAIPDIVKKLGATDPQYEIEYTRLLGADSKSLPPVLAGVELQNPLSRQQQQQQPDRKEREQVGMFPSAFVAARMAAGAPVHNFFRRPVDGYILNRGDAVGNNWLGAGQNKPVKPQPQREEKSEKKGYGLTPPRTPSKGGAPEGEELKYNPILLQGKVNYVRGKDTGVKNQNHGFLHDYNEPCVDVVDRNLREKKDVAPSALRNVQKPQEDLLQRSSLKKPISNLALQDLFLLYDEKKKRLLQEREHRSNVRNPMNYQPKDAVGFRGRAGDAAARIVAEIREPPEEVQKRKSPALALPSPPTPPPRRRIEDAVEVKSYEGDKTKEKDIDPPRAPEVQSDSEREGIGKDAAITKNVGSPSELAFVLREMTNHFESVHSSLARVESGCSSPGLNATPRRHINDVCGDTSNISNNENNNNNHSTSSHGKSTGTEKDNLGYSDHDDMYNALVHDYNVHNNDGEDPGQEFADAMGTTLDLQNLQRSPISPAAIPLDSDGSAIQEHISLTISRCTAVPPVHSRVLLPASVSGQRVRDALVSINEENDKKGEVRTVELSSTKEARVSPTPGVITAEEAGVDGLMEEGGLPFSGGCLCDGVHFSGDASTIYGSFVCNCVVCSRFSGSMMGVEWLHIPDVVLEAFFTLPADVRRSETPAAVKLNNVTPAGAGVVAAQALARGPISSVLPKDQATTAADEEEEEIGEKGKDVYMIMPPLTKLVLEVPVASGSTTDANNDDNINNDVYKDINGRQVMGEFTVYFCSRCGCTIGMSHYDIEGGLISKAALSDVSLAVLESFQQTVQLSTCN